jgi:hypothetical protein
MSTEAQVAANRANSQHSTGPKSAEGKDRVCLNAFRHGLAGAFMILPDEVRDDFDELHEGLRAEHKPETPTEILLIESMAQHYWLKQRALRLQNFCFDDDGSCDEKQLALFLRYQTNHDRAFHKALNTFLRLRADKKKAEIGFVSQQRKADEHARKQAAEKRREELHKWKVLRAEADIDHRILQNLNLNLQNPEYRLSVGAERIIAASREAA